MNSGITWSLPSSLTTIKVRSLAAPNVIRVGGRDLTLASILLFSHNHSHKGIFPLTMGGEKVLWCRKVPSVMIKLKLLN